MNHHSVSRAALVAVLAFAASPGQAAETTPPAPNYRKLVAPGTRLPKPNIVPASDDALNSIQRMKLPEGLEMKLWAAEPMLANPVAFNIDDRGRVFVTETYRYRSSTLDIRHYIWMLEDDLASRTIEDRSAMLLKNFGPEGVKELSIESEILRLIEDTDGDGVGDRSSLFADGFNTPLDGIASGVVARRGDVWFTNIPSVWKLTGERKAETRTELTRGYGVHFSLTGHDMHGPTFGPDGKIYFSFGDRGAHVTTKEGKVLDNPDMGAVYRMNPDGTLLERFADGLRNPQSLIFTENGDLFTGDNDSDKGDQERLVHIVEGGDSGWRIGYQHAPLTAVERIGPWSAERMWEPRNESQPAFMLPPICNIEDGPSGVAYYPGTGLNSSYFGNIFICHFKGQVANSGIYTYTVKPKGSSYEVTDSKPFLTASLPTDVRFGPDGRMYISDWTNGYDQPFKGRIYTISDPKHVNDPLVKETKEILAGDWTKRPVDEVTKLLGHADWRVRLEAQYTLAERGAPSIAILTKVASTVVPAAGAPGEAANLPAYARRHAIWGLGQLAVKSPEALAPLRSLLRDADPEVRAQSLKVLGEAKDGSQADNFLAALKDENARVKFFAAQSLGKVISANPALAQRSIPAVFEALTANNDQDAVLRHALVMALVATNDVPAIAATTSHKSRSVRLAAVLALRRLQKPEIAQFLNDSDAYIVREAAIAINDAPINAAMPALAAMIAPATGTASSRLLTAELTRSLTAANKTLADAKEEQTKAKAAAESAASSQATDRVRSADANYAKAEAAQLAVTTQIEKRASEVEPILYRAINANFRLGQPANATALAKVAANPGFSDKFRSEALAQLGLWAEPPARDRVVGTYRPIVAQVRTGTASRDPKAARDALAPVIASLLDTSTPAAIQSAALVAVDQLHVSSAADAIFAVIRDESQSETNRIAALSALDKINDPRLPEVVKLASASTSSRLRLAALPITARLSPDAAAPVLANFIKSGTVDEQKAAFEALGTLKHPTADSVFIEQLTLLAAGKVPQAVQLELLEGAAKRENAEIKKLLTDRDVALTSGNDPLAPYQYALAGGDRVRGQTVFETQPALACIRCHRVGPAPGGDAGPNLADVGTKYQRDYLLESVVKPSAKIAPGFDTIVLTLKSGGVVAGIVSAETPQTMSLRNAEGKIVEVTKADIVKREGAPSSMPEVYGAILSKAELRDVVEYLASLRAPGAGGRGGRGAAAVAGGRGPNAGGRGGQGNAGAPPPRALKAITAAPAVNPNTAPAEAGHP